MEGSNPRDPWWLRHPIVALVMFLVGILLVGGGVWAAKVALSPVKGAGDVFMEQNKAKNIIGSQEELQERYEGLDAACTKITLAKAAADKDPGNPMLAANYTGAQQHYVTLVAEYNAMTKKLTAQKGLGDLPGYVDPTSCSGVN